MVVSVEFSLVFWGAEFLEAVGGLSRAGAATAMSVFVGAMFAGRAIGSRLARGRDTSALLRWMLAVSAAGFLLYWIAPALELRLAGLFVTGIGVANLYPLGLALALAVAVDASDAASTRAFIASGIAILVGPLALAAIGEAVGVGPGHGVVLGFLLGAAVASAAGGARRRAVGPGLLRPRAVLSDLDGVLIDSDRSSARAWRRWAVAHGLDPAVVEAALVGPPSLEVIRRVAPALDAEAEADIVEGWQAADTAGIVAMPGAAALLARLAPDRIAVVTSCTRRLALARLERAGLPAPAVLVTADMVAAGKPAPDGYLRAAELLGVEPGGCLIIEDTPGGIEAGRAAGMSVVAIASTHSRDQLGRAHRRVDRLLDLERVATLLGEG
jgi:sugar-phosphatase